VSPQIAFLATCPRCKREQLHDRFTVADLMELLYIGSPIEAHCAFCDEFWTVSLQKRVELGEVVAAACGAAAPPTPPQVKMVID
jgi:hypothetical protein